MNLLKKDISKSLSCVFLGVFFSLCCVLARLDFFIELCGNGFVIFLCFVALAAIIGAVLFVIYGALKNVSFVLPEDKARKTDMRRLLLVFVAAFFVLAGWFCMWMLFRFPGCMSPDSLWQTLQAKGEMPLSNHHPIVHTLIIKLCLNLGLSISSNPSIALATYTILQLSVLAASYAYLISTLYKMRIRLWVIAVIFASFIILPYHASLSVTMVKDVWFSAFILLLCVSLWRLMLSLRLEEKAHTWDIVMLFVSSLGMCLFRTNGLYAFILFLPFVFFYLFKKSKAAALMPVVAAVLALLITGPFYSSLGIVPPDTIESLSIPAQHIARAIVDGAELTDEQQELLGRVVDVELVEDTYTPWLSDPIKALVRDSGDQEYLAEHKGDFMKLWLELGLKNPLTYLRAHIDLIRGYIYPLTDGTVMYLYFTEAPTEDNCMLPAPIAAVLSAMAVHMPHIPVFNLFFSNGAAIWLFIALFGLCIAKRRYSELILFIPVLAVWATLLIATPLDNEFRYAYSVFATLPLMCVVPFTHVNCNKAKVSA